MHFQRAKLPIRLLFAAALVAVAAIAAAHEIEHALAHHDKPTCALHLLAQHGGSALAAGSVVVPIVPGRSISSAIIPASHPQTVIRAPRARSPPVSIS